MRTFGVVAAAVVVAAIIFGVGPFEQYSSRDINRIRSAHRRIQTACVQNESAVRDAIRVLARYTRRWPDLSLPLAGGGFIETMRDVSAYDARFLQGLGLRHQACAEFGPPLGRELDSEISRLPPLRTAGR